MPLQIIRQDITRMEVDAIVNPTNELLQPGGGTDAQIHRAAGPELLRATEAIGELAVGEAVMTPGFRLPCRYVLHTAGPVWQGGQAGEEEQLRRCYRSCLRIAGEQGMESLAFPLLSAGTYGFPRDVALRIGTDAIRDYLLEHELDVYLVVFDPDSYAISQRLYANIQSFLDEREYGRRMAMAEEAMPLPAMNAEAASRRGFRMPGRRRTESARRNREEDVAADLSMPFEQPAPVLSSVPVRKQAGDSLETYLQRMGESFRDMLLRKIDEKGMSDAACYKLANIDRKLFNKIKNQPEYHPGKTTVLALSLALRLPEQEMLEMLMKAGYTLSNASRLDLIVQYFVEHGQYDVYAINETLFAFGQATLGSAY